MLLRDGWEYEEYVGAIRTIDVTMNRIRDKIEKDKANPKLLEPIMKVEIVVPEEYMGDVIGDVNSRRGRMEGMDANDGMQEIHSYIPLSEMFGYATDLRSKTQGRGTYSMEPSHYEEVPKSVLETIVATRAKKED